MAKTEEYLSQIKYAEHRNVTKGYISRMVKEGRLHLIKGKLNVEISDAELDNKSNNDKAPKWLMSPYHCLTGSIFSISFKLMAVFSATLLSTNLPTKTRYKALLLPGILVSSTKTG